MEWIEDFELGLSDIDVQHRCIYGLIQHLYVACERAYRPGVLDTIELERITRIHFEHEERLMVACDYPDLPKHATEHAMLLLEVQTYKDKPVFGTQQLTRVLYNWLTSHMMMVDRPMAIYIQALRNRACEATEGSEYIETH